MINERIAAYKEKCKECVTGWHMKDFLEESLIAIQEAREVIVTPGNGGPNQFVKPEQVLGTAYLQ